MRKKGGQEVEVRYTWKKTVNWNSVGTAKSARKLFACGRAETVGDWEFDC